MADLTKAVAPALNATVSPQSDSNSTPQHPQDTPTHDHSHPELLLLPHPQPPPQIPRQQRKQQIAHARQHPVKERIPITNPQVPACTRRHGPPDLLNRITLDPDDYDLQDRGNVHSDDDGRDEPLQTAAREPEQGDAEGRLGPRDPQTQTPALERDAWQVVRGDVAGILAKAAADEALEQDA
jgi:hypothetical protein